MQLTEVAAAVILRADGHYLLGQRAPGSFYPGYWEFPGGKVEPGETPKDALIRELHEELEIEVLAATPWIVREHVYAHAHVRLHFFRVTQWRGEFHDHVHAALAWQDPAAPIASPMLPANGPLLAALRLPAVYGITHAWQSGVAAQLAALDSALRGGLGLVQLRETALPEAQRNAFVAAAVSLCHASDARVLVNGDVALAIATQADGVHLTARQLMALHVRPALPLVAASCHNRAELARAARLGLDFVVLGPVQPTASHPDQPGMGWPAFSDLIAGYPLPVYAIGGLAGADLAAAQGCGAHGIAAIRAAWS
ncbi:MAG: Nudix family hydrolase [Rhodocyclaceae bacterium]|nr:Nudix family hydrolase [Rhodocyclaceae bacterium]